MITELEAQRRQAAAQLDKLNAPARAAALAEGQIAALDEQIGQAKRAEEDQRRAAQQRAADIASARAVYDGVSPELRDECRRIYAAGQRLAAYGVTVEDRTISIRAIAEPLLERDRLV